MCWESHRPWIFILLFKAQTTFSGSWEVFCIPPSWAYLLVVLAGGRAAYPFSLYSLPPAFSSGRLTWYLTPVSLTPACFLSWPSRGKPQRTRMSLLSDTEPHVPCAVSYKLHTAATCGALALCKAPAPGLSRCYLGCGTSRSPSLLSVVILPVTYLCEFTSHVSVERVAEQDRKCGTHLPSSAQEPQRPHCRGSWFCPSGLTGLRMLCLYQRNHQINHQDFPFYISKE